MQENKIWKENIDNRQQDCLELIDFAMFPLAVSSFKTRMNRNVS